MKTNKVILNKKVYLSKRANLLSIWWFAILALIGTAIVIATAVFYSSHIDVRKAESEILANNIAKCLNVQIVENEKFLDSFDIFKECRLNKEVFEKGSVYFISIIATKQTGNTGESGPYKFGNNALEIDCKIKKEAKSAEKYPDCTQKLAEVYTMKGDRILLTILAVSNNDGRDVSGGKDE